MSNNTYEKGDDKDYAILTKTIDMYQNRLKDVKIGLIKTFAPRDDNGDIKKNAIVRRGATVYAYINLVHPKNKLFKPYSAEITIDGDKWMEFTDEKKMALLDHELTHVDFKLDKKTGDVKKDEDGNPILRLIYDEIQFTAFSSVARKHGPNSVEYQTLQTLKDKFGDEFGLNNK